MCQFPLQGPVDTIGDFKKKNPAKITLLIELAFYWEPKLGK